MGELGALFNPGMRHELEERRAKAARREEEGNARDGDLRIDLESGVAVINIPGADQEQPDDQDADSASAGSGSTGPETPADADATASNGDGSAAESEESTEAAGRPAPALRPRGKRGMSTSASR